MTNSFRPFILLISFFVILGCSSLGQPSNVQTQGNPVVGGTYSLGDDAEDGPAGSVSVYPVSDTEALFALDVTIGPPSYNLGWLIGKIEKKNNEWIYENQEEEDYMDCILKFEFSPGQLEITSGDDHYKCGFGRRVYADNIYKLIDEKIPETYIDMEGETVFFKDFESRE